jgi:hypothetical protein
MAVRTKNGKSVANVYHDMAGNILPANDRTAVASAYLEAARTLLDEGEELAALTVDQVYSIVSAIPGSDQAADQARTLAVYEADPATEGQGDDTGEAREPQVLQDLSKSTESLGEFAKEAIAKQITAYKGSVEAFSFGAKLDAATNEHFEALANAKEDYDGAPLPIADDLKRLNAPFLQWPIPGSRFDKPPYSTKVTNDAPDYYKVETPAGEEIKSSFYKDMIAASAFGKRCDRCTALVREVANAFANMKPEDKAELDGLLQPLGLTAKDLADNVKKLTNAKQWVDNRRNAVIQKVRKAVAFLQQEDRVNALPGFKVQRNADSVAAQAKMRSPIVIYYTDDKGSIHASEPLSLGSFIRYDVAKAKATCEAEKVPLTLGALKATAKRTPKAKGKGAADTNTKAVTLATDIHQWTEHVYSVASYLGEKDRFGQVLGAMLKDDANAKMLIEAVGDLYEELDGVMPKIIRQYNVIKANKAALREGMAADGGKAGDKAAA